MGVSTPEWGFQLLNGLTHPPPPTITSTKSLVKGCLFLGINTVSSVSTLLTHDVLTHEAHTKKQGEKKNHPLSEVKMISRLRVTQLLEISDSEFKITIIY